MEEMIEVGLGVGMVMGSSEKRRRLEEEEEEEEEHVLGLPGFRFHPTDEELVGFYLSRKVLKKPSKIDHLIHQTDIYKYDPWDLPRCRNTEKESYFFCKRGKKYRNSIRPNRVTGSGFWKATGIDKPVYSDTNSTAAPVIGLKKTLVYYLGSAGKGNKTDWMMHEFRLPTTNDNNIFIHTTTTTTASSSQDAEVWTLCRIFKRNVSNRKYSSPEWRELATNKRIKPQQISSSSVGFYQEAYISFGDINESSSSSTTTTNINVNVLDSKGNERSIFQPYQYHHHHHKEQQQQQQQQEEQQRQPPIDHSHLYVPHLSHSLQHKDTHDNTYDNWDELRSVVEFAFGPSSL